MMRRLAFYHLETLLWIGRLGTFAAAAERLNTTQPAISARVREIEAQLGIALFRREGRRMILTVRGRQLVEDCEPLWSALEQTLMDAGGADTERGIVRIGTGEIAAASFLPGFLVGLKAEMPGVRLEVSIDLTAKLLEQLLAGTSDIVFLAGPIAAPGVLTRPIGAVELVWLAQPAVAARMRREPAWRPAIWSLPRHSPIHQVMLGSFARDDPGAGPVNTCNNVQLLIEIVAGGGGIALLPATMAAAPMDAGLLVEAMPRPAKKIVFEAAVRARESDPLVLRLFAATTALAFSPAG